MLSTVMARGKKRALEVEKTFGPEEGGQGKLQSLGGPRTCAHKTTERKD